MFPKTIAGLILLFALTSFSGGSNKSMMQHVFINLNQQPVRLKYYTGKQATVFIFISPECPLCQNYALTINQLMKKFSSDSIRFIGVVSGGDFSIADIKQYQRAYQLKLLLFVDAQYSLARELNAKVTPEVFVINANDEILYNGRIDNWAYEVGKKRKVITSHDLHDALTAIKNGTSVSQKKTQAIGCFIE